MNPTGVKRRGVIVTKDGCSVSAGARDGYYADSQAGSVNQQIVWGYHVDVMSVLVH